MAAHQELLDEMLMVNNMSTKERLNHAQCRRAEQLVRWKEFENEHNQVNFTNGCYEIKKEKAVKFGNCVTLLEAAARNDYDEVKELLGHNVDPNEANEDGLTALHQACIDNFDEIVMLLLNNGANVNAIDSEYWTPLHAACTCGHINIAKILVQRGADLLALNADHNMPFDICEEPAMTEFIENAMADKGISQSEINEARKSREKFIISDIEKIVESGGELDIIDKAGATVLHVAAANGYIELARFYLRYNPASVNAQDKDGWTPLHAAACWCQMEILEILTVEHNADPSVKNNQGEIPADVTDDVEIKALLQKLLRAQKESKKSKLIRRSRLNGGGSSRGTGDRGESFKGRSKRDKKKVISSFEANSEAEFWQKGQKTELDEKKLPDDGASSIAFIVKPTVRKSPKPNYKKGAAPGKNINVNLKSDDKNKIEKNSVLTHNFVSKRLSNGKTKLDSDKNNVYDENDSNNSSEKRILSKEHQITNTHIHTHGPHKCNIL